MKTAWVLSILAMPLKRQVGCQSRQVKSEVKLADKPGSVVDSHSSRRIVANTLEQPTRWRREQRQCQPIWSCCGWRLPRFTRCDANSQARWSQRLVSVALFLALYLAAFNVRPLAVILLYAARTFLPLIFLEETARVFPKLSGNKLPDNM